VQKKRSATLTHATPVLYTRTVQRPRVVLASDAARSIVTTVVMKRKLVLPSFALTVPLASSMQRRSHAAERLAPKTTTLTVAVMKQRAIPINAHLVS